MRCQLQVAVANGRVFVSINIVLHKKNAALEGKFRQIRPPKGTRDAPRAALLQVQSGVLLRGPLGKGMHRAKARREEANVRKSA